MINPNRFLLNVLFFFQALLIFLLIFESRIQLPLWLDVLGRLHPAIVHLPIGFISLYLILYLVRFNFKKKNYQKISVFILLITSLSAVVAAICGLFLSRQGDYESITFHKWSAVLFNFVCYAALILQRAKMLQAALAAVAFVVLSAQVFVVGHSGGELTHGKGYVFAPLHKNDPKDSTAKTAYDVAVRPVLEKKCFSCHNENKAKGKLVMTSVEKFLKGGKHGAAFVAGEVQQSRMIKNILQPMEMDDHMPPSGKPQLSDHEKKLLMAWIKSGAAFDKLLSDYAPDDSLKILASKIEVVEKKKPVYTFDPASLSLVEKLNSPFRAVFPLYKNSPALRADFFVSEMYKPEALQELSEIKTQLTELSLSKMPVTDKELTVISHFENLEMLNLNFSKINGSGLENISGLKHLRSLSLAGTTVTFDQLQKLSLPAMKELYLWNTSLTVRQISELKNKFKSTKVYDTEFVDDMILKLQPPSIASKDVFKKGMLVELKHPMKGVTIRYTTDGTAPDSVKGMVYEKPFAVSSTFKLTAIACKDGWRCSDRLESLCFVEGVKPTDVKLLTQPDKTYKGEGATTLIDNKLGLADQNKEPMWLGYRVEPMEAVFTFDQPKPVRNISISYAKNLNAYLFPPARVELYSSKDGNTFRLLKTVSPEQPASYTDGTKKEAVFISLDGTAHRIFKIKVTPVPKLPPWHGGKGERGWVFVDEVFFN